MPKKIRVTRTDLLLSIRRLASHVDDETLKQIWLELFESANLENEESEIIKKSLENQAYSLYHHDMAA